MTDEGKVGPRPAGLAPRSVIGRRPSVIARPGNESSPAGAGLSVARRVLVFSGADFRPGATGTDT
jgi:hypothetical protein